MRKKCGLFVELCLGLATVLLIVSSFLFLLTYSGRPEPEESPPAPRFDIERRYEAVLREKGEIEGEMEAWGDGGDGRAWLTPRDSGTGEEACRFVPYVSDASGDVSARVLIEFAVSGDVSADRLLVAADGVEQEMPVAEIGGGVASADEKGSALILTLPIDEHLPLLERVAESGRTTLRLLGGGEEREAVLSESQIRNLGKVLRLREIYKEAWALGELRRMF